MNDIITQGIIIAISLGMTLGLAALIGLILGFIYYRTKLFN